MSNTDDLKIVLKNLDKILRRRHDALKQFIGRILVICSSLLGILIAFNDKEINDRVEFYWFSATVLLLGLSILIGLTALYNELHILNKLRLALAEVAERLRKGLVLNASDTIAATSSKVLEVFEYVFYVVFGVAVCSLVGYAWIAFS